MIPLCSLPLFKVVRHPIHYPWTWRCSGYTNMPPNRNIKRNVIFKILNKTSVILYRIQYESTIQFKTKRHLKYKARHQWCYIMFNFKQASFPHLSLRGSYIQISHGYWVQTHFTWDVVCTYIHCLIHLSVRDDTFHDTHTNTPQHVSHPLSALDSNHNL